MKNNPTATLIRFINQSVLTAFLLVISTASASVSIDSDEEFAFAAPVEGDRSHGRFWSNDGVPRVFLREVTPDDGDPYSILVNQSDDTLVRYDADDSVSLRSAGRYQSRAYAIIHREYECGDDTCHSLKLYDDAGNSDAFSWPLSSHRNGSRTLDTLVTRDRNLAILTDQGIQVFDDSRGELHSAETEHPLNEGVLRHNPNGAIVGFAASETGQLFIGDLDGWHDTPIHLAAHGDRNDILAAYPDDDGNLYAVVYRYVNEYNKGLYLIEYDRAQNAVSAGPLFNSSIRNIGFYPDLYLDGEELVVSATDSSERRSVHFLVDTEQMEDLDDAKAGNIVGFREEKKAGLLVGGGVSRLGWFSRSRVRENSTTFLDVDYEISDSLFYQTQLEGRWGNRQLAITYMRNEAEEAVGEGKGDLARAASSRLFATLDFHGLLEPSSTFRILYENSEISGIATREFRNEDEESLTEFTSSYDRYALMVMAERGFFLGADFVRYDMPAAIGFEAPNGQIGAYYDEDAKVNLASLFIGFDTQAYARRYETNYRQPFLDLQLGVGLGRPSFSSATERQAEEELDADVSSLPIFVAATAGAELGYIWQRRSRTLRGGGFQVQLGYRVNGVYMTSSRSDDSDSEALTLIWEKLDLYYGPFARAALVF